MQKIKVTQMIQSKLNEVKTIEQKKLDNYYGVGVYNVIFGKLYRSGGHLKVQVATERVLDNEDMDFYCIYNLNTMEKKAL